MEHLLTKIILGGVAVNIGIQWFFLKKLWNHEQRISRAEGCMFPETKEGVPEKIVKYYKKLDK